MGTHSVWLFSSSSHQVHSKHIVRVPNLKAMQDHRHNGKGLLCVTLTVHLLHGWKCNVSSSSKGQSAMSSLWACCCIQSPPCGWADALPDGSHLDMGPTVASSQDSCLVMVVNVTISHRLDSWTECPEKSRCWPCCTWFSCSEGRKSQCSRAHPGLCLWNSSLYCTEQQPPLYLRSRRNIKKKCDYLFTNISVTSAPWAP